MSLIATGRSSTVSKARYTVDIPPAPMRRIEAVASAEQGAEQGVATYCAPG